jgi:transposase-like protein
VSARHVPNHIRRAAVADYQRGDESLAVVAARYGVSKTTLHEWVKGRTARRAWCEEDAYRGGWELRGGVRYPLFPERRSA